MWLVQSHLMGLLYSLYLLVIITKFYVTMKYEHLPTVKHAMPFETNRNRHLLVKMLEMIPPGLFSQIRIPAVHMARSQELVNEMLS